MKASIAAIKGIKLQEDLLARLIRVEEKLDSMILSAKGAEKEVTKKSKKVEEVVKPK